MLKELENIRRRSSEILGSYPERRAALAEEVRKAEAGLQKAKEAQEVAEDLETFDKEAEAIKRAELVLKFAKQKLEKMEEAPRMEADEYDSTCNTCRKIATSAATAYREKTAELMASLKAAYDEYNSTIADVNSTLTMLDNAANVLQSRHPYRVEGRHNAPDVITKDPNAWKKYALQFDAHKMATDNPTGNTFNNKDLVLINAWNATVKAYPGKA